ncbi:Phage protein [Sodalis praecaptivus]|uniref:Phage protein n=1 Tax=Sodalis praecaptivus TaxID=1239307 RepID=W0I0K4_9GAMM|nr:hypothetical protein [Sodalis praecaptivus]AHF77953.1 Phage protein [Sodalis praecaptivus]
MVTPVENNALRAVARQCSDELHSALKDNPSEKFNTISRPIILKHAARVEPRFSLCQLIHAVGVLNGQYPER